MKYNWKKIVAILIVISVFGFMFVLNCNTTLVTDDFIYQFVFEGRMPSSSTRLVSNPFEIFESMSNHWQLWGGRVTVHFLLQFAFMLGIGFFNIVNSIMFVLLGILIYKHVYTKKDTNLVLLIAIYAAIFLFVPQPGSTILWKSGSANYLWSSVMILSTTYIFKCHFDNKELIKDNILNSILIFLLSLFVGCCNENSGCALILAIILFMIAYKIKYNKVPSWSIYGLVGTTVSYILLLASPGNYIRADEMYPGVKYGISNLIEYFIKITRLSYEYLHIIIIVAVITSVLVYQHKKSVKEIVCAYGLQIIFIVFTLASIYSLVLSPAYPERCWMFAFVYLLVIIGLNFDNFSSSKYSKLCSKIMIILMIIMSLKAVSEYNEAYYDIYETRACIEDQAEQIKEQVKAGKKDISVHGIPESVGKYNAFTYNGYLTYNADSWTNRWIAKYYGINSIVADD